MDSWKSCGEGFSGIKKLRHVIDSTRHHVPREKNTTESQPQIAVVSSDSPDVKKRSRPWDSHKKSFQSKVPALVKGTWKPDALLENFQTYSTGSSPRQNEDIESATSSSDDGDADDSDKPDEREAKNDRIYEKRKGIKNQSHLLFKKSFARNPNVKSRANSFVCHHRSELAQSDSNRFQTFQSVSGVKQEVYTQQHPDSNKTWTISSFENFTSKIGHSNTQCTRSPCLEVLTSDVREERLKKSKVVRRLHRKLREDSPASISDVDSDCEEHEECDIQADHNGGRVTDRKDIDESSPVSSGISREYLSLTETSPASSRKSQLDEKAKSPLESKMSISSCASSQAESCVSGQRETIKASEWISSLQKQKTPVKQNQSHDGCQEDSAKKKRKFESGSLADRLCQIQRRLKSSVRMWSHSSKTEAETDPNSKYIDVVIESLDKICSLYLCHCKVASEWESIKECSVFFSCDLAESLALKTGTTVQIYPPWQKLLSSSGDCTLLCTDFVRVVSPTGSAVQQFDSTTSLSHAKAVWNCPCVENPSLISSLCPVIMQPFSPYTAKKDFKGEAIDCSSDDNVHKHQRITVTLEHVPNFKPASLPQATNSGGILQQWAEMNICGTKSLRPFSARVLRVFVRKSFEDGLVIKCQLLLVDSRSTVAIATLPSVRSNLKTSKHDGDKIQPYLNIGRFEGKMCLCSGFMVASRISSDQKPNVFTVLKQAWPKESSLCRQSQSEAHSALSLTDDAASASQQSDLGCGAIPNFAFELQAFPFNRTDPVMLETQAFGQHRTSHLMTLHNALQEFSSSEHLSSVDSLFLYEQQVDGTDHTIMHRLYLNQPNPPGYLSAALCLCRDVCLVEGQLKCDEYSLVLPQTQWSAWGFDDLLDKTDLTSIEKLASNCLILPMLNENAAVGTVVRVEGFIKEVDDTSAFSFVECSVCGSTLTVLGSESRYCRICGADEKDLISVEEMAVFFSCSSLASDIAVKVQLAQTSVNTLLPNEPDVDGYDVDQVIGQFLTCRACLVDINTVIAPENSAEKILILRELECFLT
ncbi:DNA repair-scaffolding protein [Plakobranchus ocellatus]|uniref:DNA repair-scaffolding protein n=1 Tax=Plakobranchus ocellatus TaxID=259542 RepID=A0AAV3ZL76_9GAST|nr:DNA repair-scaffolding protein [Plakobranchus ocellatus]